MSLLNADSIRWIDRLSIPVAYYIHLVAPARSTSLASRASREYWLSPLSPYLPSSLSAPSAKGLSWTGSASKAEQKHFRNSNSETRKEKKKKEQVVLRAFFSAFLWGLSRPPSCTHVITKGLSDAYIFSGTYVAPCSPLP